MSDLSATESPRTILVMGATGNQGAAAVKALVKTGFSIRAFTRDSESKKAKRLAQHGIQIAQGDLDDDESLLRAMDSVYGVFSVINFRDGVKKEEERGKRVADAAKRVGVKHFVYSSVGGAERNSGIPHVARGHTILNCPPLCFRLWEESAACSFGSGSMAIRPISTSAAAPSRTH